MNFLALFIPYDWNWSVVWQFAPALGRGLLITLELTGLSIVFGTIVGFAMGILLTRTDDRLAEIKFIVQITIDIVRSLPLLILILLFNYYSPYILSIRSAFWLTVIAMSINLAAFIADVLRGAIQGVPAPLVDAGYALGMTESTVLRRVVVPEATRQVIPSIALLYIDMLKMSSLASVISVNELTHVSYQISSLTYRFLEMFSILAIIYILILFPFSVGVRKMESSRWFLRRS